MGMADVVVRLSDGIDAKKLRKCWLDANAPTEGCTSSSSLMHEPFRCFALRDVITVDDLCGQEAAVKLTALIDGEIEMNVEDYPMRQLDNDLLKLRQSVDLADVDAKKCPILARMREFISHDLHALLEVVTDQKLDGNISMTLSEYRHTDHLLCHDDHMPYRRIAYVLYLTPDEWTEEDGGALRLFDTDVIDEERPNKIVASVLPHGNQLTFFQVGRNTFHEVQEVYSPTKRRLSINGWFHTKTLHDNKAHLPQPITSKVQPFAEVDESVFRKWIAPQFIVPELQQEIREQFQSDSEIMLSEFFNAEQYEKLSEALNKINKKHLSDVGPANLRRYKVVDTNADETLTECETLLRSDAFALLLSQLTGVRLHELYEEDGEGTAAKRARTQEELSGGMSLELRRFTKGGYTMIADEKRVGGDERFVLDAYFFVTEHEWTPQQGSTTYYVDKRSTIEPATSGEDEKSYDGSEASDNDGAPMVSITPQRNTLALVYRDTGIDTFVKYINCTARGNFDQIVLQYTPLE